MIAALITSFVPGSSGVRTLDGDHYNYTCAGDYAAWQSRVSSGTNATAMGLRLVQPWPGQGLGRSVAGGVRRPRYRYLPARSNSTTQSKYRKESTPRTGSESDWLDLWSRP